MRHTMVFRFLSLAVVAILSLPAAAQSLEQPVRPMDSSYDQGVELGSSEVSFQDRIASLESRLGMVESRGSGSSSCNRCPIPSTRISTKLKGCSTSYSGAELLLLKPHVGALSGNVLGAAGNVTNTFDYDLAPRIFMGRERADGLGFRATYFQYDHGNDPSGLGVRTGLELHALDIEATSRTRFCGSDLMFTGGFRYANMEQDFSVGGNALNLETDGVGLTIGTRMSRDIGNTGWDLIIGGRASFLLTDNDVSVTGLLSATSDESTTKVLEAQLAVSRTRELSNGAQLVSQFGLEVQNWEAPLVTSLLSNDISLFGPTIRMGLNF